MQYCGTAVVSVRATTAITGCSYGFRDLNDDFRRGEVIREVRVRTALSEDYVVILHRDLVILDTLNLGALLSFSRSEVLQRDKGGRSVRLLDGGGNL